MKTFIVNIVLIIAAALTIPAQAKADTSAYDELFNTVDWMAKKYSLGTVYVSVAPLPDTVFGGAYEDEVVFNSRWVNDPAGLHAAFADDVASGYHPGANCTAAQSVAVHETAHILDSLTGHSARRELVATYGTGTALHGQLSSYSFDAFGVINPGEALADAVLAVECDTPTEAELALYGMLTS